MLEKANKGSIYLCLTFRTFLEGMAKFWRGNIFGRMETQNYKLWCITFFKIKIIRYLKLWQILTNSVLFWNICNTNQKYCKTSSNIEAHHFKQYHRYIKQLFKSQLGIKIYAAHSDPFFLYATAFFVIETTDSRGFFCALCMTPAIFCNLSFERLFSKKFLCQAY